MGYQRKNTPKTRTIDFVGGPLHGSTMEIPWDTTATTCAKTVYMVSKDDPGVFTPSGLSVNEAKSRHNMEQEFAG